MKKKSLVVLLAIVSAFALACGFTACDFGANGENGQGGTGQDHIHNYNTQEVAPTCTEQGYIIHSCSCGDSYKDTYIDAIGHKFTNYISDNNATCTTDGSKTATCDRDGCNVTDTVIDDGSKLGHSYGELVLEVPATCTKNGMLEHYYCSICQTYFNTDKVKIDDITIQATGHQFGENSFCTVCGIKKPSEGLSYVRSEFAPYYIEVSIGTCTDSEIVIGDFYDGEPVRAVAVEAFKNCNNITNIILPESIESIGHYAFEYCTSLKNINIPDNVTTIGRFAFSNCSSLTSVVIPDSVKTLGDGTFSRCTSISSITIGKGLTVLGENALYNCTSLVDIDIDEDNNAFCVVDGVMFNKEQTNLICYPARKSDTSYAIPESVVIIGECAFWAGESNSNGTALTSITIPSSVKVIRGGAFWGRLDAISQVHISDLEAWCNISFERFDSNPLYVANNLYLNGELITDIVIPDGIKMINDYAFINASISNVVIPDTVTYIGKQAFWGCTALMSITIPEKVTVIGKEAFYICNSLFEVNNLSSINITKGSTENGYVAYYAWNVYTPTSGERRLFTTEDGFTFYQDIEDTYLLKFSGIEADLILPDNFNGKNYRIYKDAFKDCTWITTLTIPDGVLSVDKEAFSGCIFTEATIPALAADSMPEDSLETLIITSGEIADNAFWNCLNLTNLTVENGVTSIGKEAFYHCSSLTSVNIGDGVTIIGDSAFLNCTSLESVSIGNGVATICNDAFRGCTSLTSVAIGNGVISIDPFAFYECPLIDVTMPAAAAKSIPKDNLQTVTIISGGIADYAFSRCSKLTDVTLANGVTAIGNGAFSSCISLKNITISDSVTYIGEYAFQNCSELTSVTISKGVTSIGEFAFWGCTSLTDISIPEGVTEIENATFRGCTSLNNVAISDNVSIIGNDAFMDCSSLVSITIPQKVVAINKGAFQGCSLLVSLSIPDSVVIINEYAFGGCSSLVNVTIGSGVSTIGNGAFIGCESLSNLIIGNKVTSIGSEAFSYCTSLSNIKLPDSVTDIYSDAFVNTALYDNSDNWENGVLYVGKFLIAAGQNISGSYQIKQGTTVIAGYAFFKCNSLTDVTIPQSVNTISTYAFNGCSNLKSITVDAANESYSDFNGVLYNKDRTSLVRYPIGKTTIAYDIPDGVTDIRENAFNGAYRLKNVTYNNELSIIGDYAFYNCTSLMGITIPDSVTQIGKSAFADCSSLTSATFGSGLTAIGGSAFRGCSSLESVIIPDGVSVIEDYTFEGCVSLKSVYVPDGVTKIGEGAFSCCALLTSMTIPDTVTEIGYSSFSHCVSLTQLSISNCVTIICSDAFYDCTSIIDLIIPDGVKIIGDSAFSGCSQLKNVVIGNGVTSIGYGAFKDCVDLTSVFYRANAEQWENISIQSHNMCIENASRYYYSKTEPELNDEGTVYNGNFWHYDDDGITPVLWLKVNAVD